MFIWIESVMFSREMFDAIWIEDWKNDIDELEQISDKFQKKLVKMWRFFHMKLTEKKGSLSDSLTFLANIVPILIKTKYFLNDDQLRTNVTRRLIDVIILIASEAIKNGSTEETMYQAMIHSKPETFRIFPETFEMFRHILTMTASPYDDLDDVKALQSDQDATLATLYQRFIELFH